MDANTIVSMIGSLGFPIVCCVYLIYNQTKQAESHKEEIDKLRETVENNTKVMVKIATILGIEQDGDD